MLDGGLHQAAGLAQGLAPRAVQVLALPLVPDQPVQWIARLAHGLRVTERRPLVLDAGQGLLVRSFGLRAPRELLHLLQGGMDFERVAQCTADGVWVLRAERGLEEVVCSGESPTRLLHAFAGLAHGFDAVLLAMPAQEIASLAPPARTVPVIGLQPGRNARVAAYETLKRMAGDFGFRRFSCVVHGEPDRLRAIDHAAHLSRVAADFLSVTLGFGAWLPDAHSSDAPALGRAAEGLLQSLTNP